MSDEVEWLRSSDLRGELGPMLDRAVAERAPGQNILWDVSYALLPQPDGGLQLAGVLVLTKPSPNLGEGLIAGAPTDHRRLLLDYSRVVAAVDHLLGMLMAAERAEINAAMAEIKTTAKPFGQAS